MSKLLATLLSTDSPMTLSILHDLERATGNHGIDVRMIADTMHTAHAVMRQMGLNPADTTAEELYAALGANTVLLDDCDYVGLVYDGAVVSFNRSDVETNRTLAFAERTTEAMQRALQHELARRFMAANGGETTRALIALADIDEKEYLSRGDTTGKESPMILAIGDIVTDAFIQLREDEARVDTDEHGNKRLSMEFGNKPPYERVDIIEGVGNSANAAVAFARLGLGAGLLGFVGDDTVGADMKRALTREGVDVSPLVTTPGMKSNYHYVLRYGADRTILIKYEDYDYFWHAPAVAPDWIYLSAISDRSWQLHEDLATYLTNNPAVKLAFQPGTYHFKWGAEKLAALYALSEIVFMNREEAALVSGRETRDIGELMAGIHTLGPRIVVITDGPDGAYASDGTQILKMPNYPDPAPPLDRTGAGDAFASTMVAALASGETLETALTWAPINSMSVVQKLGAQAGLLDHETLMQYVRDAPEFYHPQVYTGDNE